MKKLIILILPIMVACSKGNEPIVNNKVISKDAEVIMAKKKDTINVIVYYANSAYNNVGQYPVPGAPINAKEYDDKLYLITGQAWPDWWMVIKKWKRSDYPTDIYQPWPPKK